MKVTIDGKEYVPAEASSDATAMRLLAEVYGALWTEAFYDPYNAATQQFAEPLARKLGEANQILKFRV